MRVMLEIRKKKEVCNHVHQKIPQTQNTYLLHILIFFLATFEVNYKEQKTRYILEISPS